MRSVRIHRFVIDEWVGRSAKFPDSYDQLLRRSCSPVLHSNMPLTQQFAGYALVVSFLLQIVTGLLPDFRIIAWLLQFYIVYVVWEGVPILMGVEEKQRLKYTLLSSVLLILCPAVIQIVFNRLTAILN